VNDLRRRQERLDRARRLARLELVVAFAGPVFAAFLFVATPGHIGRPMYGSWVNDLAQGVGILGVAGVVFGLVTMVRIYRADPEPDDGWWRYRRF
jgi:hypothetical protein